MKEGFIKSSINVALTQIWESISETYVYLTMWLWKIDLVVYIRMMMCNSGIRNYGETYVESIFRSHMDVMRILSGNVSILTCIYLYGHHRGCEYFSRVIRFCIMSHLNEHLYTLYSKYRDKKYRPKIWCSLTFYRTINVFLRRPN